MSWLIVGLGNPGTEYENTRHNSGRMMVNAFRKKLNLPDWVLDQKLNAQKSSGQMGKAKIILLLPEGFMNKSGNSLKTLITNKKIAGQLVVIHDDLDLPLGTLKIVFNRGSGGHRGVESVIRSIKTEAFIRLRVGISPADAKGRAKKPVERSLPAGRQEKVSKFILGKFKPTELERLKKITKKSAEALGMIVAAGLMSAMNQFNSK